MRGSRRAREPGVGPDPAGMWIGRRSARRDDRSTPGVAACAGTPLQDVLPRGNVSLPIGAVGDRPDSLEDSLAALGDPGLEAAVVLGVVDAGELQDLALPGLDGGALHRAAPDCQEEEACQSHEKRSGEATGADADTLERVQPVR